MTLVEFNGLDSVMRYEGYDTFMKKYQLRKGLLVIDAKSVYEKIYANMLNRYDIFGGNYDCYAREVKIFFDRLAEVEVCPYVVFLGGHFREPWKVVQENRIDSPYQLKTLPFNDEVPIYPLCIREVFLNEVVKRNLYRLQLTFEYYIQIFLIAKRLAAPLLANHPIFYLFDIRYIPFDTLCMNRYETKRVHEHGTHNQIVVKYYNCKVVRSELIIAHLGLSDNKKLFPVVVALMGESNLYDDVDYMHFLIKLGIKVKNQRRAHYSNMLAKWLKSIEPSQVQIAIEAMYDGEEKKYIWDEVQEIASSYTFNLKRYFRNFEIDQDTAPPELRNLYRARQDETHSTFIHEKIHKLEYPPGFTDMIHLQKYFLFEIVPIKGLFSSHEVSLDIIRTIFAILRGNYERFRVYMRNRSIENAIILNPFRLPIVSIIAIQGGSVQARRITFRDHLICSNVDEFEVLLHEVPEDWKLLLIAIKYFLNYKRNWDLIYAVLLCKILLWKVQPVVGGFHRTEKDFDEAFKDLKLSDDPIEGHPRDCTILQLLEKVTDEECIIVMSQLIHFFELKEELTKTVKKSPTVDDDKTFDREMLLELAEFQSCLLHIDYLNTLYNCPYPKCDFGTTLNCTFIFNCAVYMRSTHTHFTYITNTLYVQAYTVYRIVLRTVDLLLKSCSDFY